MASERPSYYVCAACLGDMHQDCASIYEPGSCACACRHAADEASRSQRRAAAEQVRKGA